MCGIAGVFAYRDNAPPVNREELLRIRESMVKRGPDGAGLWVSNDARVGLAHRRLAIIDLSEAGAQPMATVDENFRVTFNGEIYNYRELRKELEAKGYRFRSNSDTEVLLHLYAEHGAEMVHRLRGMFAFGIWDERNRTLFLARDPFGIKPLYYVDNGETLRFASQVKALVAGGAVAPEPEPAGTVGFLLWGYVPEPFTLYRVVRALPAGSHLTLTSGSAPSNAQYFSVRQELLRAQDVARAFNKSDREALGHALRDSVYHHLVSDVPVGVFLSAGIDSTVVTGFAAKEQGVSLRTLTLGFNEYRGTGNDEVPLAERTATVLDTKHETHWIRRKDFQGERESVMKAMDQPSTDGMNTYFICRAAARAGIKVALSGLGGDELFGGYPSFRDVPRLARWPHLSRAPGRGLRRLLAPLVSAIGSPKYASLPEYAGTYEGAYLLRRALFLPWEVEATVDPFTMSAGLDRLRTLPALAASINGIRTPHATVAALELSWYMRNQLLRDADWAGMAHSVEIRVPLIDAVLFRAVAPWLVSTIPPKKNDMASAAPFGLDKAIVSRAKSGFQVPIRHWTGRGGNSGAGRERGLRGWAGEVLRSYAPRPPRALVSTLPPDPGGVATMTRALVELLRERGYAVELAYHMSYRSAPALSVPFWRLPFHSPGSRLSYAFADVPAHEIGTRLPELEWFRCFPSRYWRRLVPHFDCFFAVSGSALAALPVLLQGKKCVAWVATPYLPDKMDRVRGYPWYRRPIDAILDTPFSRILEKVALRRAEVLALSQYTARELRRVVPGLHCDIMPMSIDAKMYASTRIRQVPTNVIGFCGRFADPRKNISLLLEAVACSRAQGLELQCEIVGDEPTREMVAHVKRLSLEERVRFLGARDRAELPAFYNRLDVFVIPSTQEGLGIVGLEAMACGCPVVSTRCGGAEDYVHDGVNGFLVGFSAEEMADALGRILSDAALYARMSKAARRTVMENYGEQRVRDALWAAIDRTFDGEKVRA